MKKRTRRLTLSIQPICLIYLSSVVLFSSFHSVLYCLVSLAIHEAGHILTAMLVGGKISQIELTPYGGIIRFEEPSLKGIRGLLIAAGGPLANLLALMILGIPLISAILTPEDGRLFAASNTVILLINTVPVLPLDGGRMLFTVGYYICPIQPLTNALCFSGILFGISIVAIACYGFFTFGCVNISLVLIGLYLCVEAFRERNRLLAENALLLLQERKNGNKHIQRIRIYQVSPQTKLTQLVRVLVNADESLFLIRFNSNDYVLKERELCHLMMISPHKTIAEVLESTESAPSYRKPKEINFLKISCFSP